MDDAHPLFGLFDVLGGSRVIGVLQELHTVFILQAIVLDGVLQNDIQELFPQIRKPGFFQDHVDTEGGGDTIFDGFFHFGSETVDNAEAQLDIRSFRNDIHLRNLSLRTGQGRSGPWLDEESAQAPQKE